jgi:hypothetical protein
MAENPDQEWRIADFRPAHGAPGNPCAQCTAGAGQAIYCNQLRGGFSVERARRVIAERIAANKAGKGTKKGRPGPAPDDPEQGAGRPW